MMSESKHFQQEDLPICWYSALHCYNRVPATTTIDGGVVGIVQACAQCAEFFERNN